MAIGGNIQIIYTLDDTSEANYTYDSNKIEFTASGAKLKLVDNPAQFEQTFDSSTGFTFDSAKTEFVAGNCEQKNNTPANVSCAADFDTDIDLSYGSGVLDGTATGGAGITNGKLDLTGGTTKYVTWDADLNADSQQVGCWRGKRTPNYTGNPAATQYFFFVGATNGYNRIQLHHNTGGNLAIVIHNDLGATIMSANAGMWSPTSGTEYEFELNWDLTTGATRLFIDGVQQGSTFTQTGTRGTNITLLRIGDSHLGTNTSNFFANDDIYFTTVQHTANYTPAPYIYRYLGDLITYPNFTYAGLGTIQAFVSFIGGITGPIRFNINGQYWTGLAWAASDDSYAQMNDATTINTNISSLAAADTVSIKMRTIDTNDPRQLINNLVINYTGQAYPSDNPTIEIKSFVPADGIFNWEETDVTKPTGTNLKYILPRIPSLWWDGLSWTSSDDTYAESNTEAEIVANLSSLDISQGATLKFLAFLNSDGTETPIVKTLTLNYDFYVDVPLPNTTVVYGNTIDLGADILEGATVSIKIPYPFKHGNNMIMEDIETTSKANGFFDFSVVETETITQPIAVEVSYTDGTETNSARFENVIVPNTTSVGIGDLIGDKKPVDS